MKLNAVHHVALWVSDLEKAKDFYVRTLGFDVLRENRRDDRGDVKLDLQLGDAELELFCAGGHPARSSYPEALGLRHLAFRVENMDVYTKPSRLPDAAHPAITTEPKPLTEACIITLLMENSEP